jgi:hypothetical protein
MSKLPAVFTTLLALAACAPEPRPPVVNPAPAKLLRVHGAADDSLTVRVSTRYLTTKADCQPQSRWVDSDVSRASGNYEAMVAIDHFQPGECGWYPFVIAFHVTNRQGLSTGEFSSGPAGTTHVPGPEGKVWISAPGGSRSSTDREPRRGASFIRPLELGCAQNVIRGARGLSCVPDSPRELPLLSEQATEVRVDFRDLTAVR